MKELLRIQLTEEENRFGGINDFKSFEDLSFIDGIKNNSILEKNYIQMQDIYIFNKNDFISFSEMVNIVSSFIKLLWHI